jgi:membrane associated rhomboid family serine protease
LPANRSFGKREAAAPPAPRTVARPAPPLSPPAESTPTWGGRLARRIPWFTLTLSLVLVARFLEELRCATDYIAPYAPGHYSLLAMGASDRAQVLGQGEWWRLFTATVLHGSPAHLIGNLITFLMVGFLLEPMIGIGWFAAIYFTGGFAGALLSTLFNPADSLSVGASGAIMATLAALFALSFHVGAKRPALMRRIASGSLFPALIPTVASGGTVMDINAHFGGCIAGTVIAFGMLIAWNDEEENPPARRVAAAAASLWLALTGTAFALATPGYAAYARPGLDLIPPEKLPKDVEAMKADSLALVEHYPKDPRAHFYRGLYLLEQEDAADAEPYFRDASRLGATVPAMSPALQDWNTALLALSVRAQHRGSEARTIVAPLCAAGNALDVRTRQTLEITQLCK